MKSLVLIESPYRAPTPSGLAMHRAYLDLALRDSISRGECPIATHKLYTDCLDDSDPDDRKLGMDIAEAIMPYIEHVAVYYDLGISNGMKDGILRARYYGRIIQPRSLFNYDTPYAYNAACEAVERTIRDTRDNIPF